MLAKTTYKADNMVIGSVVFLPHLDQKPISATLASQVVALLNNPAD